MPNSRLSMADNVLNLEEHSIEDDRPLAIRRKRRISTGVADPVNTSSVQQVEENGPRKPLTTPTKPKKRVRFSDPGPDAVTASSSTGLTPHLSRASFAPRSRETSPTRRSLSRPSPLAPASRRLSLPTQLSTSLPSPSLSPSPVPLSGEFQFAPLRQVLDSRLKRRLRRNHLSEETNDIDAEKRSKAQYEQEIKSLRDQLAMARESEKEHSDGTVESAANSEMIRNLQQELEELKRERSTTAEPISNDAGIQGPLTPEIRIFVDDNNNEPSSSAIEAQQPPKPEINIFVDEDDSDVFIAPESDDNGALRDVGPVQACASVTEAATQASLPSPHAETFRAARLSLEYLFPGEIALGLIPEDPKPLFDVMLERMQTLRAQTFMAEDALSRTQTQETNLRNQFNAVLEQLDRARKYAEGLSTRTSTEKARADASQARVQMLEISVQAATGKVNELEKDADEKDRSIQKLQDALDTYRVEVGKLEMLITQMEGEHNTALSNLRAEMDEAVADLECHVAAETTGRREAEHEVEERTERIRQLKVQGQELKNALNEKQQIIRETERIFEEERVGREREVGGLNVQIGQLSTDLSESKSKVGNAKRKQHVLMQKLQEERDAGVRAVEAVQAELASAVGKSEDIKTAHVSDVQRRGAEVTEHKGLLTPVSACRFKDVEGYVEVRRDKGQRKNRDSGVVIREEDEDEDMVMVDDM